MKIQTVQMRQMPDCFGGLVPTSSRSSVNFPRRLGRFKTAETYFKRIALSSDRKALKYTRVRGCNNCTQIGLPPFFSPEFRAYRAFLNFAARFTLAYPLHACNYTRGGLRKFCKTHVHWSCIEKTYEECTEL